MGLLRRDRNLRILVNCLLLGFGHCQYIYSRIKTMGIFLLWTICVAMCRYHDPVCVKDIERDIVGCFNNQKVKDCFTLLNYGENWPEKQQVYSHIWFLGPCAKDATDPSCDKRHQQIAISPFVVLDGTLYAR